MLIHLSSSVELSHGLIYRILGLCGELSSCEKGVGVVHFLLGGLLDSVFSGISEVQTFIDETLELFLVRDQKWLDLIVECNRSIGRGVHHEDEEGHSDVVIVGNETEEETQELLDHLECAEHHPEAEPLFGVVLLLFFVLILDCLD